MSTKEHTVCDLISILAWFVPRYAEEQQIPVSDVQEQPAKFMAWLANERFVRCSSWLAKTINVPEELVQHMMAIHADALAEIVAKSWAAVFFELRGCQAPVVNFTQLALLTWADGTTFYMSDLQPEAWPTLTDTQIVLSADKHATTVKEFLAQHGLDALHTYLQGMKGPTMADSFDWLDRQLRGKRGRKGEHEKIAKLVAALRVAFTANTPTP